MVQPTQKRRERPVLQLRVSSRFVSSTLSGACQISGQWPGNEFRRERLLPVIAKSSGNLPSAKRRTRSESICQPGLRLEQS
jgi:hypothetical protein